MAGDALALAGRMAGAYAAFVRAHLLRILEYRASFAIGSLAILTRHAATLLTLWVIFGRARALAGWSVDQVLFLYGTVSLIVAFHHLLFFNTYRLEFLIHEATLDRYLLRPLPTLFQLLLYHFDDDALGDFVPAIAILAYAAARLGIELSAWTCAVFAAGIAGGVLVHFGIHLVLCSWSFWFVKSRALIQLFAELRPLSHYPLGAYGSPVRTVLCTAIPLAFAGFFPAEYLARPGTVSGMALLALPVGLACFALGLVAWSAGLARYSSAGS